MVGRVGWAMSLGLVAGCQSASKPDKETPAGAPTAVTAAPAARPAPAPPAAPYTGYHRYQGTVGGRPVTVTLTFEPAHGREPAVCRGAYYYGYGTAGTLTLESSAVFQPGQPLALTELSDTEKHTITGQWQASQPAGPVLRGTWASPGGRPVPFALREEYQDARHRQMAVRYEVLTENDEGPLPEPETRLADGSAQAEVATLARSYLHLLGPDTLRPALRQLQCPAPAQRRAEMRASLRDKPVQEETEGISNITFNDYGLLSVSTFQTWYMGGARFGHSAGNTLYDLATGEPLGLAQLLRPGAEAQFRALVARHLQPDADSPPDEEPATDQLALDGHVGLELNHLLLTFEENDLPNRVVGGTEILIPYAEVAPLLRPNSPVARMLRARGLWREGKKK